MMSFFSFLSLASVLGFSHAFEADHLAAMSNLISRRDALPLAIKDAASWGFGHTSTILFVGSLMILGHLTFPETWFLYLEVCVGVMLILLGLTRLVRWIQWQLQPVVTTGHQHPHLHREAYGIGLVHGLAGSGSVVLLVMLDIKEPVWSMIYLLLFGLGSVAGMVIAAVIMGTPVFRKHRYQAKIQQGVNLLSSLFCLYIGVRILLF
jgi:high-affinity nickel permease